MFVICVINQWMKRSKHGLFVFPQKKTLIWRRHYSIGQSCCSMTSKRSIDRFLESSHEGSFFHPSVPLTNQKPRAFVSVRQTNQIALFPFARFVRPFSFRETSAAFSSHCKQFCSTFINLVPFCQMGLRF